MKAKEEEIKLNTQMTNYEAWLNGLYIRQAIASVFSKGTKYPEKPIDNNSPDRNSLDKEKVFKSQFEAWANLHNSNLKN